LGGENRGVRGGVGRRRVRRRRRGGGRECNSSVPYIIVPGDTSIS